MNFGSLRYRLIYPVPKALWYHFRGTGSNALRHFSSSVGLKELLKVVWSFANNINLFKNRSVLFIRWEESIFTLKKNIYFKLGKRYDDS